MSQRSSAFGGSTMSATSVSSSRRFPSALERNNPDVRPSILALVDTSKPISQQVDQIKAATQREAGSPAGPRVTSGDSDVFRLSQRGPPRSNASHHSIRSFGSYGLTPNTRRQTSGELGKGDDGLIVAMRKKAAEERRKKHLREVRASQAGSTISRGAFGASRVSNSSFGISRIGLHSSTGSGIRPASSFMGSRSQLLPRTTTTTTTATNTNAGATPAASPHRFEDLRYVQEVLARSRGTSAVSSRASSPEATKPESPYAALAARARGALFENTRGLQEAKAEKRKEEARRREMERERQRRDARMEMLAKLAAEEEEERLRREEEVLSASNRKRDAAGTLRYSPEDAMDNSVHPYGKEAKDPRKRSLAADSLAKNQQPTKRSRSSEPADDMPRSSDRKLMPPPPAPNSQHSAAMLSSQPSMSFGLGPEEMEEEGEGEEEEAGTNRPANHSVEPEIGMPVSSLLPSSAPLGGAPIARDFAYPGGPILNPEPVHAGSDTEPDDEEEEEEEEEELAGPKGGKPEVVSLLDSDDDDNEEDDDEEETFNGFGDYDDEEEEEEGDEEEESEEEDDDDEDDSDNDGLGEPTIIPICSSPVPENIHDDDAPETNGSTAPISDSSLAEDGGSSLTAQAQASGTQNGVPAAGPLPTTVQSSSQEKMWMRESGGRLMRSASPESVGSATAAQSSNNAGSTTTTATVAQSSSFQGKARPRNSGGRFLHSATPENVGIALAAPRNNHDAPNGDNHDAPNEDEATGSELPIDPLLNPGIDAAIPAVAHAH
ncbi:hypothetical protein TWF481_004769 [Arthrobotrys musiformis]|uniref:Uncharacterized protein n=1 Tax=Arthrobotrys musiformis TaxID=47236 RepID=A0AAV9WKJ8_9PEZI